MSETTSMAEAATTDSPNIPPEAPALIVNIQFIKDLSFEAPGAPKIFTTLRAQPAVQLSLSVERRRLEEARNIFEVVLIMKAKGTEPNEAANVAFIAELSYAGVFTLNGIPENSIDPVLLTECPKLLFPFARNILADITRDGGFPPVLLQPIDFVALWQSRKQGRTSAIT